MLLLSCFRPCGYARCAFWSFCPAQDLLFPPNICSLRPVPHGARAGTTSAGAAPHVRDPERRRRVSVWQSATREIFQVGRTGRKIIVVALPKRGQFENLPTPVDTRSPLCPKSGQNRRRLGMSAKCHVWTAPSWQGLSSRLQHWSVQPCVRPLDAAHMAAGHNALRGSGPGQKHAFENAMALVGCPDRRIDRLCITCCSSSQPSHHASCPA